MGVFSKKFVNKATDVGLALRKLIAVQIAVNPNAVGKLRLEAFGRYPTSKSFAAIYL